MLLAAVARMGQKIRRALVFGCGRGHQQIVGPEPMRKLAKLGAFVQANVGLINHQANLQTLGPCASHHGSHGAHIVVTIGVIALGARLRFGHGLRGGNQHRARHHILITPMRKQSR